MNNMKNGALFAAVVSLASPCTVFSADYQPTASDADVNRDGIVKAMDLVEVVTEMNMVCTSEEEACESDIDRDDAITINDLLYVVWYWGHETEHVLEPNEQESDNEDSQEEEYPHQGYAGPNPVVMDSVYFDVYSRNSGRAQLGFDLDQAWRTRHWNMKHGVDVIPYAYHGGVDWDVNLEYNEYDLGKFSEWLDDNVPHDYDGPVVLDMEGVWWDMMTWAGTQQAMDEILDFYIEGLHYAQEMRPNAKFGYWGLPRKDMTSSTYTGPSVQRLLMESDAIFPDTYESNPGGNDVVRMTNHVTECLKMVNGEVPVHVQMFPRYKDNELGGWRHYHDKAEFIRDQARPALEARWTDAKGGTHRVASIAIWDCYNYEKRYHANWDSLDHDEIILLWDQVDLYHTDVYEQLVDLVAEYAVDLELNDQQELVVQDHNSRNVDMQRLSALREVRNETAKKKRKSRGRRASLAGAQP